MLKNIVKIILSIALFVMLFLVALLVFFPYERVVEYGLARASSVVRLSYSSLNATMTGATINGLTVDGVNLGTVNIKYSPLSLVTRAVTVESDALFGKTEAKLRWKTVTADGDIDAGRLLTMLGANQFGYTGKAQLHIEYNLSDKTGVYSLDGGEFRVAIPPLRGNSVTSTGSLAGNVLTIDSANVDGSISATAAGVITLNYADYKRSELNIRGDVELIKGVKSGFTVRGTIASPRSTLQ